VIKKIIDIIYFLTYPELPDDNVVDDGLHLAPGVVVPTLGKLQVGDACTRQDLKILSREI
jgi:hypothetical protein